MNYVDNQVKPELKHFLCTHEELQERIALIDPRSYEKTRNHLDGDVTWLSPFICHGVIDTTSVAESLLARYQPRQCYRFLFELAWREYFHRNWQMRGDTIFENLLSEQNVPDSLIPNAVQKGCTGIDVLDTSIKHLLKHGTMHNHARMWTAGVTCNTAHTAWFEPARWLHYHLLDGDLASNSLSWQWIAGTFSNKRYIANQDNLNKHSSSEQKGTWLDCSYEELAELPTPAILIDRSSWHRQNTNLVDVLGATDIEPIKGDVALRSIWNLDATWNTGIKQHVLFIDSDFHERWPLSPNRWQLIRHWLPENTQVMVGTLSGLLAACSQATAVHREYPACYGWPGNSEPRRWLYANPENNYTSFSQFWKQVKTTLGLR